MQAQGLHAAGFVSYEAAPAFDRAVQMRRVSPHFSAAMVWAVRGGGSDCNSGADRVCRRRRWLPLKRLGAFGQAEEYAAVVARLRDAIAAGETYQVNYTFRLKQRPAAIRGTFSRTSLATNRRRMPAYVETRRYAICSASPELFFELDGLRIASRPMKGTIARGRWYGEDLALARQLAASEKDRAENAMIVDMLRNDLGRIARVGSVRVSDLFHVERYPTLWQMTSRVSAETAAGLAEIFAALFPCASITGAPKVNTMRIIARTETAPRRIYTGSIGRISPGGGRSSTWPFARC